MCYCHCLICPCPRSINKTPFKIIVRNWREQNRSNENLFYRVHFAATTPVERQSLTGRGRSLANMLTLLKQLGMLLPISSARRHCRQAVCKDTHSRAGTTLPRVVVKAAPCAICWRTPRRHRALPTHPTVGSPKQLRLPR